MSTELERVHRRLAWNRWANAETLGSLRTGVAPPEKALRWMAHIVGAEFLWLVRLREQPAAITVWPELNLDQCASGLADLAGAWQGYLVGLPDEDLDDGVGYRNTKGEFWTSTVGDILDHVVTHSAYHRGQIAAAVRQAGHEPAYTDFIHAARQRLID